MNKPTIFFSHSSLDKEYISTLRDMILKATAGTVEIFQSSDGGSIPFGNNWVHKVEENLNKAKIMLVFVSPKSVSSSWVYFESGFAYAKGVKVVPIGICGVDVGQLKPPLSLLQGFNIVNAEGINNILTVANREFECNFHEGFTQDNYYQLSKCDKENSDSNIKIMDAINYIQFSFYESSESKLIVDAPLERIKEYIESEGGQCLYSTEHQINSYGIVVSHLSPDSTHGQVRVRVDPYSIVRNESLINELTRLIYKSQFAKKYVGHVVFNSGVDIETREIKISSKLHQSDIKMSKVNGKYFTFDSFDFTLEAKTSFGSVDEDNLKIVYEAGKFDANLTIELASKLVHERIINIK